MNYITLRKREKSRTISPETRKKMSATRLKALENPEEKKRLLEASMKSPWRKDKGYFFSHHTKRV